VIYSRPFLKEPVPDCRMLRQWANSFDNAVSNDEVYSGTDHDHITVTAQKRDLLLEATWFGYIICVHTCYILGS
jgi:hypothetical protein